MTTTPHDDNANTQQVNNNPSKVLDFNEVKRQNYYSHRQLDDPNYVENLKSRMAPRARDILFHLYPNGKIEGNEFVVGDVFGAKGRSFKISLASDRLGVGADFETGQGFADLIDIWAAASGRVARRESFGEICEEIESFIGNPHTNPAYRSIQETKKFSDTSYRGSPTATYYYTDKSGCMIAYVQRYDYVKDGKKVKETIPWDGATKKRSAPDVRPLFNQSGIADQHHIMFVEGEKAAEALITQGIPATTSMGGSKVPSHKIDWSPIAGKSVIIWPDNDKPGLEYADMVAESCLRMGCKDVRILSIPNGHAEGWDAADAIDEGLDVRQFIRENDPVQPVRSRLEFKDADEYEGEPAPVEWLVGGCIPLASPVMVAAMGDTGKSYLLLDLCVRVACGEHPADSAIFGGQVCQQGTAAYITSEDPDNEIHRRLEAIDPGMSRIKKNKGRLKVLPLPDRGGAAPLVEQTSRGINETDHWFEIKDRLAKIDDLKLVVFDPLQSFCLADINADPAAGQYMCSMLTSLAAETGATVIVAHHMRKPSMNNSGKELTPEEVRSLVRGTSALVDGMRLTYGLWRPAAIKQAKAICGKLNKTYKPNCMAYGAVLKANGQAPREISTYLRAPSGLLVDHTYRLTNLRPYEDADIDLLVDCIADAAANGHPFTRTGISSTFKRKEDIPETFRTLSRSMLEDVVDGLIVEGRVVSCNAGGKSKNVLDIPTGDFAQGIGHFEPGTYVPLKAQSA